MSVTYPQQDERLLNHTLSVPPDLVRWWRRVMTLERGKAYSILVMIPSDEGRPTWTVMGSGKLENEE